MKFKVAITLIILLLSAVAGGGTLAKIEPPPTQSVKEKPCRMHPQLVGRCFTLRGRLSVYSGNPSLRIWRIGTRRILGVSELRFAMPGYRNVPENVEKAITQDVAILGDFLVCPFTRSRPREMQLVCVESVRNMVVQKL